MPNYVSLRVSLSGPASAISRFKNQCIRERGDEGDVGFDFQSLVSMPPSIIATMSDPSELARVTALAATGFTDCCEWSRSNWGSKWNAQYFFELRSEVDSYEFGFDTAWSFPEPIFRALALAFPDLNGEIFAAEPAMDWGAVTLLSGGKHACAIGDLTPRLKYLAYEWDGAAGVPKISDVEAVDLVAYVNARWDQAHDHLSAARKAQITLAVDLQDLTAAYERYGADAVSAACSSQHHAGIAALGLSSGAVRIHRAGFFATPLDRELVELLAEHWLEGGSEPDLLMLVEGLCRDSAESTLRAWASHAMYREGTTIDMADAATLRVSLAEYAMSVSDALATCDRP